MTGSAVQPAATDPPPTGDTGIHQNTASPERDKLSGSAQRRVLPGMLHGSWLERDPYRLLSARPHLKLWPSQCKQASHHPSLLLKRNKSLMRVQRQYWACVKTVHSFSSLRNDWKQEVLRNDWKQVGGGDWPPRLFWISLMGSFRGLHSCWSQVFESVTTDIWKLLNILMRSPLCR